MKDSGPEPDVSIQDGLPLFPLCPVFSAKLNNSLSGEARMILGGVEKTAAGLTGGGIATGVGAEQVAPVILAGGAWGLCHICPSFQVFSSPERVAPHGPFPTHRSGKKWC